jgi:MFS transporter, PAT family, beta-lactamase induction signal transducer AmpG
MMRHERRARILLSELAVIGGWLDSLRVYRDRRVLAILLLGFASGLPLLLTLSTLSAWLATQGVSKTSIGLFAAVGIPYSFKFAWSPLIDGIGLPLFGRLGRRRGWAVLIQLCLIAAVVALGSLTPKEQPALAALLALLVAFLSASQDIVIDAYRVEILRPEQQGAGATMVQVGYRVGLLVAGAGALFIADRFGWHAAYYAMAGLLLVGIATILANPEPRGAVKAAGDAESARRGRLLAWLEDHVVAPFADFMRRPAWLAILLFILLYKLGDAVAGIMATPLYINLGFSLSEIASVSKIFGFVATLAGAFLGGLMVTRWGLFPSLLVCGILQSASNLMYALQAMAGHDLGMLALTIATENVTGGMGSAALVAYLSGLCTAGFAATQYALLSSLAVVGRTMISTSSGWLADRMDWPSFFVLATFFGLPGILVLLWIMRRGDAAVPAKAPAG